MPVPKDRRLPDPDATHPIILPDGSPHLGTVHLARAVAHPKMSVGDFTYASDFDPPAPDRWASRLAPYLFEFSADRLTIGRFCQIAHGVRFIGASANHATSGVSTYPFPIFDPTAMEAYQPDTRDMIIGHDVWLGYGALVLPGARIGNGAIIGAGAVVRGAVPDYAIVTGNPAQVVRMRFTGPEIGLLNRLSWWDWPTTQIEAAIEPILHGDIATLERLAKGTEV